MAAFQDTMRGNGYGQAHRDRYLEQGSHADHGGRLPCCMLGMREATLPDRTSHRFIVPAATTSSCRNVTAQGSTSSTAKLLWRALDVAPGRHRVRRSSVISSACAAPGPLHCPFMQNALALFGIQYTFKRQQQQAGMLN